MLFLLLYNTLQQLPMVKCSEPSCGMKVKIFLMVLGLPCCIMALAYICFPTAAEEEVTGRNHHVYSLLTFEFFSTTMTMIRSNDGSPIRVLYGNIIHYLITTPSAVSFIDAGTGRPTRFRGESLTPLFLCSLATLSPLIPNQRCSYIDIRKEGPVKG